MTKNKQRLVLFLTILIFILAVLLFDGLLFANKRVHARKSIITDDKISDALDGFKIVYFSDVHYNLFVDEDRLTNIVKLINNQNPHIVLLGGDFFNQLDENPLGQDEISFLIDTLNDIKAPYGKFVVSGSQELESEYAQRQAETIFSMGEFELINNQVFRIYYNGDYFNLIGLLNQEISSVLHEIDHQKYSLAFSHQPQNANLLKNESVDLMLAGFTHGGQINLPVFNGAFFQSQPYTKQSQMVGSMRLDISSGVGTDRIDIRLFADGDILVYTLRQAE